MENRARVGIAHGVLAYTIWGIFPIYYKLLQHVPAVEVVAHRIVWSCVALIGVVTLTREWKTLRTSVTNWNILRTYTIAAVLIAINWLTFVIAVSTDHVVQASLGYFMTPLINVLIGTVFLRERLRPWQWIAVALAGMGVTYLTMSHGEAPWIALSIAFSFGFYGLVKKTAPLSATSGLTLETAVLVPAAMLYLLYIDTSSAGAFPRASLTTDLLLIGAGFITTLPLLLFASAAKRIPLSLVGLLQYIAPTLQFFIGVLLYAEPFTHAQVIGFSIVWTALAIFTLEGLIGRRLVTAPAAVTRE